MDSAFFRARPERRGAGAADAVVESEEVPEEESKEAEEEEGEEEGEEESGELVPVVGSARPFAEANESSSCTDEGGVTPSTPSVPESVPLCDSMMSRTRLASWRGGSGPA